MKSRTALNIVALVLAVVAGASVFVYTSSADRRALENQSPKQVVVSRQEIPAGTLLGVALDQGWLVLTNVPQKSFPQGALQSVDNTNRALHVLQNVPAGQILFSANLEIGRAHV